MAINEPFNEQAGNDGEVKYSGLGYSRTGSQPAAIFTDSAGNEAARLTGKQLNAWIDWYADGAQGKCPKPPGVHVDISEEQLMNGRDMVDDYLEKNPTGPSREASGGGRVDPAEGSGRVNRSSAEGAGRAPHRKP